MRWGSSTRRLPHLLWAAALLLGLLAAWNLLRAGLLVRAALHPTLSAARPASAPPSSPFERLLAAHLFGGGDNAAATALLGLRLEGVYAAHDGRGYALLAGSASAPARAYASGERLPGGVQVAAVYPDRVLLRTAAGVAALTLPRPASSAAEAPPATEGPATMVETGAPAAVPPQSGANGASGPAPWPPTRGGLLNFGALGRAQPVIENGRITGYRVLPGVNPVLLVRLGLRPGDVITAIDGTPLGGPVQAMQAVQGRLRDGQPPTLTVMRDGRTLNLGPQAP
jgi:general secretion pathway protein C